MNSASEPIEGLKLIEHNASNVNRPDDPGYPFKLVVNCAPPELMQVAFIMLHGGTERLVVRGKTRQALDRFVETNSLLAHPRLYSLAIYEGDEVVMKKVKKDGRR